jgi:hypothetical protein
MEIRIRSSFGGYKQAICRISPGGDRTDWQQGSYNFTLLSLRSVRRYAASNLFKQFESEMALFSHLSTGT